MSLCDTMSTVSANCSSVCSSDDARVKTFAVEGLGVTGLLPLLLFALSIRSRNRRNFCMIQRPPACDEPLESDSDADTLELNAPRLPLDDEYDGPELPRETRRREEDVDTSPLDNIVIIVRSIIPEDTCSECDRGGCGRRVLST